MRNTILIAGMLGNGEQDLGEFFGESFVTQSVSDEKKAIDFITEKSKKICSLIMDCDMKGEGAKQIIKYLKATNLLGKFPIIASSTFNKIGDDLKHWQEEIDDIIERPYNKEIVVRRVRNLVELYNYRRGKCNKI